MGACHDAGSYILNKNQKEGGRLAEKLYFAYGSNMNLDQMDFFHMLKQYMQKHSLS